MLIQWYPGHMAKAKRMLQENLKLVDAVAEVVDARAPEASRNPDFDALFVHKARLILLNKADLAETPEGTIDFLSYGRDRIRICAKEDADIQRLVDLIEEVMSRSFVTEELLIPFSEGGRIGELQRKYYTQILEYTEEGTLVRVTRRQEDRKE